MIKGRGLLWLTIIISILMILLGIASFLSPEIAFSWVLIAIAVTAIVIGIMDIIIYVRIERYTGFVHILSLIAGILSVMSGLMMLSHPSAGIIAITILFPIWFLAHCISNIARLEALRIIARSVAYYISLVLNIIGIVIAVFMIIFPTSRYVSWIIGTYLIVQGLDALLASIFSLRN